MPIELKAAPPQEVSVYGPYYREPNKRQALPYAISLYKQGEIIGERHIEGSPAIPFVAAWRVTSLPSELVLCRVTFAGDDDMTYEIDLQNAEFVGYMIDVVSSIKDKDYVDFPQLFYSRLFRIKLTGSESN